ncbi:hypothetical protein Fcan01_05374 [Folsomia candida]|uniref:Uncharacterized protein n=1 Tax=Folsomia candida TaxID=158441 RepID=A0A226EN65_FOLCA|nr:hypothetical protein Fcan01_05374 [Folsomia candida]
MGLERGNSEVFPSVTHDVDDDGQTTSSNRSGLTQSATKSITIRPIRNRHSVASIEFVNKSDCSKIEVQVGNQSKFIQPKGITKFQILEATPSVVRGYDKAGRQVHEVKFTIGSVASSQVWKVTNSGVKHKRSPFFTETHTWQH